MLKIWGIDNQFQTYKMAGIRPYLCAKLCAPITSHIFYYKQPLDGCDQCLSHNNHIAFTAIIN